MSLALIGTGLAAARRLRTGRPIVVGPIRTIAALAGGGLVIVSFLVDTNRVLAGDSSAWTGWPVFWAGMALATAATVSALTGKSTAPVRRDAHVQPGTGGRPSLGPDR
ncbi:MAG: hypothetical protein A2Z32_02565 [Chloroflexi bacterium RBG_16_69_14]|nr:MAG: hypothetical protein A2Z32_02565 [Chloroflexi bacterium RBG_16_69_14]